MNPPLSPWLPRTQRSRSRMNNNEQCGVKLVKEWFDRVLLCKNLKFYNGPYFTVVECVGLIMRHARIANMWSKSSRSLRPIGTAPSTNWRKIGPSLWYMKSIPFHHNHSECPLFFIYSEIRNSWNIISSSSSHVNILLNWPIIFVIQRFKTWDVKVAHFNFLQYFCPPVTLQLT